MLVLVAMAALIGLIFLMSGSTGGLFAKKIMLRSYFENAAGLRVGAPVTLEGVTIGNVVRIRVVPEREPNPVEVDMRVGSEALTGLHTDSTASIAQAGVLGDSYVDISSEGAKGPEPSNNTELKASGSPSIQDLIDSVNAGKGTLGQFVKNPELYNKISQLSTDLHEVMQSVNEGKGTLGKLVKDDTLYNHLDETVQRLDHISAALDDGKGTAGKFLRDETLYNNLNSTVRNLNELVGEINAGHGALGKLSRDPEFAKKFDDSITKLDHILTGIDEGKGTVGQLFTNKALYDNLTQTTEQSTELLKAFRANPKKYLTINLKLF
jgi:phospholipid/cholesterol/gamma-HCH transport system substrate-binding protein